MRAKRWPQPINQELGQPVRQPGWHRAGAFTAVAALGLGLQFVAVSPTFAATDTASEDDSEVSITQTLKADPSQFGCVETDAPGIPAGCRMRGTLEITNLGPHEAKDVVVTDELPKGLLDVTVVTPASQCTIADGMLTCKLGTIPVGGTVSVVFTGKTAPKVDPNGSRVVNVARVDASGYDPDPADNVSLTSRRINSSSDLAVTQDASTQMITPGNEVTLTVTATNYGPSDAENVRILASSPDPLMAMLSDISVVAPDGSKGTCDAMPNDVNAARCDIDVLPVGTTATVKVVGRLRTDIPDAHENVDFDVNVSADTFDANPNNNTARTTVVSGPASADLNIGVDDPEVVAVGQPANWVFTAQNAGPSNSTNASVKLDIPDTLTDVVVTSDHGPCTEDGCDLGLMYASEDPNDPGNTATIEVRGTPTVAGDIAVSATISGDQADPDPENTATSNVIATTDAAAPTDSTAADLVVSDFVITPLDANYTGPGSDRRIQFTVTNNGPDVAETTWFRLTRTVDATAHLSGDLADNCMFTARELMCAVRSDSDLQPGESVNIDYPITIASIGRVGNYTDYVHVYSQTPDPDETNNYTQADIVIADSQTSLDVTIEPMYTVPNAGSPGDPASLTQPNGHPSFIAGGDFTYKVSASVPEGAANANNVNVKVQLPKGFVPTSAVSGAGHCTFTAGDDASAECVIPTVNAGTTSDIAISGYLKKQANNLYPNGDTWAEDVAATVSATSDTPTSAGASASATASTNVDIIESADLEILVTPDEHGTHEPGTAGYTISVLNDGPSGVEHAAISAMLPLGATLDERSDCLPVPGADASGNGRIDIVPLAGGFQLGAANAVLCAAAPNTADEATVLNAGQEGNVHLVIKGSPEALAKGFTVTAGSLAFDPDKSNNSATVGEDTLPDTGGIPIAKLSKMAAK